MTENLSNVTDNIQHFAGSELLKNRGLLMVYRLLIIWLPIDLRVHSELLEELSYF